MTDIRYPSRALDATIDSVTIATVGVNLDVDLHDGSGNPITSQVNGSQQALDVGVNVAGVQVDPRDIRALTNADVVSAEQSGTWAVDQSGSWSVDAVQSGTWAVDATQSGTWSVYQSGPWTVDAVQAGTWTVDATQSGTWAVDQSGTWTVDAVQSGTWTVDATQSGTWAVDAVQSGTWTVQPGNTPNTTPWLVTLNQGGNSATVTASNALKVDGSAVTQPVSIATLPAGGGRSSVLLYTNNYASVNLTTSAYVQVTASTTGDINRLYIADTSGSAIILATGAAGSEVDRLYIGPGGNEAPYELNIPSGTRVAIKALDVNATSGRIIITALS